MSQTWDFLDQRARAAEAEAREAPLANVRERELRSAKAWRVMADRQLIIEGERIEASKARAARRLAGEAAALARTDAARHHILAHS